MPKNCPPWDQKLARFFVRKLLPLPITPNQLTILSLLLALVGAGCLTLNDLIIANLGAGIFVFARFFDHFDGELARQKNLSSVTGYYLDYLAGGISYASLFVCLGIRFQNGYLGEWSLILGFLGATSALTCLLLNLKIDNESQKIRQDEGESVGYPSFLGFELEDGIYLLAPITWLGGLEMFFYPACFGAITYGIWTLFQLLKIRKKNRN